MRGAMSRLGLPRIFAPSSQVSGLILGLVLGIGFIAGSMAGGSKDLARFIMGGAGGIILFIVALSGRLTALKLAVGGLVFLGVTRRLIIPFAGWSQQDPILLVGPAVALMIWINGRHLAPKKKDAVTTFVVFFLLWVIAQLFNPAQHSMLSSLYGLIFWLPPIIWFFVGRTFHLNVHKLLINIITVLAIYVAAHGLYHTFVGLFSFEYTWLGASGFGAAIFINGFNVRPFSSLVSPQEYGLFLSFVLAFLWSSILADPRYRKPRLILFSYLTFALFYQGSRSIFALFLIMLALTSIIWVKGAMKVAVAAIIFSLVFLAKGITPPPTTEGADLGQSLFVHQLQGLLNPGSEEGTGPLHLSMISDGFARAWERPLGYGLAAVNIAAGKDDTKKPVDSLTTEADITDVFVSFGVPTGSAYLFFIIFIFLAATRRFKANRTPYSLGVIAMLIVMFGHIWTGALYAVVSYTWLTLGGLTRPFEEEFEEGILPEQDTEVISLPVADASATAA